MHSFYTFFLQAGPYRESPGFVLKAGMVVLLLAVFIVVQAVIDRRKSRRLSQEKQLLQQQFDSQLMQNRLEVQEDTFNSIGAELHDNIGQLLSTAKMFIGITERELPQPPLTLLAANETLDKAITELRSLSKSLNRDWLEQFDLYRNLADDAARINAAGGLQLHLNRQGHVLPANAEQQFIFYRLLQEGIQNVIKHSGARHLHITIGYDRTNITGTVKDDGKGFPTARPGGGLGMTIMRDRTRVLKGRIRWESSGSGTSITIIFPIKQLPHE